MSGDKHETQGIEGGAAPSGLARVFLSERQTLSTYLIRRLGNASDAEDALQDVWIKLQGSGPTGPVADPVPYLFRMCENAARDARRSEARRHAREALWVEQDRTEEAAASPEAAAIERDRLTRVQTLLNQLPSRTRQIFAAFRLDGKRQKEIARDQGISVSAVQKHLHRAYAQVEEARNAIDGEPDAQSEGP